ncbi:DUF4260 family protein [Serinicoccus marinus]|uniref:DUF4260 family protein n=1 Tax=Serinicoccus marinus TaxID=247333 RepID=UPI0024907ADE|nr:DUF4260 family protein [Serinicoccus marinus]
MGRVSSREVATAARGGWSQGVGPGILAARPFWSQLRGTSRLARPRLGGAGDARWSLFVAGTWAFHIAVDRLLGYGLKFTDSFAHTHLGEIGKKPRARGGACCGTGAVVGRALPSAHGDGRTS